MSERRIKVPEGMLKEVAKFSNIQNKDTIHGILSNGLRWLSENPLLPSGGDVEGFLKYFPPQPNEVCNLQSFALEWQRRMFLEEKPIEIPVCLRGRTFTQNEADQIKAYVQMCVGTQSSSAADINGGVEPKWVDPMDWRKK